MRKREKQIVKGDPSRPVPKIERKKYEDDDDDAFGTTIQYVKVTTEELYI